MQTKKSIFIGLFSLTSLAIGFSQEASTLPQNPAPVTKGEIILADGTNLKFSNLYFSGDSVIFKDAQSGIRTYSRDDVFKVSKTGNYAVVGAIAGGLLGYASAKVGTTEWEDYDELRDKRSTYVTASTFLSATASGLVGYFIKWERPVFRNDAIIGLHPTFEFRSGEKPGVALTCRITISK